jgi:hypothetical protein
MMTDYQSETAFLRQCILYDDTGECHKLEESITQAQRNERCLRRATGLMVMLTALSMAGLSYAAIFLTDHPQDISLFITPFICKVFSALGLGSLICLVSFAGLRVAYRKELDRRREECRRLAAKLLESRLGKPRTSPLPGIVKEEQIAV